MYNSLEEERRNAAARKRQDFADIYVDATQIMSEVRG